jgi:hypothetical protein
MLPGNSRRQIDEHDSTVVDLKVERTEQYIDEVKAAMAAYADSNLLRPVRVRQPQKASGTSGSTA